MRGLGPARIHRHPADQRGAAAAAVPGAAAGAAGRPARERRLGPRPLPDHPAGGPGGDPAGRPHPDHGLRRHLPGPDDRGPARPSGGGPLPQRAAGADRRAPARRPHARRLRRLAARPPAAGRQHRRVGAARHGRRPRGGGARVPLPVDPTRGDALVPRPPHGLHRARRLLRAGGLPHRARRRRGRVAAAARPARAAPDDLRPGLRRGRVVRLPRPRPADAGGARRRAAVDGGRAGRRRARQRGAVAGVRGGRRALPAADPQRVQRAPLRPRAAGAGRAGPPVHADRLGQRSARGAGRAPERRGRSGGAVRRRGRLRAGARRHRGDAWSTPSARARRPT